MAIDPICKMTVDEATARSAERDGQTFFFCSEHCRVKFLDEGLPVKTQHHQHDHTHCEAAQNTQKAVAGKYICPMCEGVASEVPDNCPKCGMALELAKPTIGGRKTIYTCPMHPEIEQETPGSCPKCGMDLEAKYLEADEEDDSELRSMTQRFWVGVALSVPVFLLAMLPMVSVPIDVWVGRSVDV